ncbi:membrane protein [Salinispora tropica]|uniref:Polymorphic outer membrane protein n=1 Tax=Salinispora tropica (strain ATCC BAA-916 / DSM 44818 / JCM 13857 / NBRC 105044 / CNB-440) TaxID=369723 RepID=A4XBW5_SALTO|nr:membrane protein [Salinispora tropica]ABP56422.1 hypothetical protein Strop_3992 [Salinispora tropica CNB-440]
MNHQHQVSTPGPRRTPRAKAKWWTVGLAGVTGLALTTGVAAAPAAAAVGRTLTPDGWTSAEDHRERGMSEGEARGKGKGKGKKDTAPNGTPVPCDADALIAAITLANARDGAVLDLAKDCTYLLTADIDGNGLPAITAPITLNGGKNTTIERAATADGFRILTVDAGGNLILNKLTITGGQTDGEGGGILVNPGGTLTTNHSSITRNITNVSGGGIANNGTTRVNHSTVERNTATSQGGGISSTGLLEVVTSHIDNNKSIPALGGGIYQAGSTVTIKGGSISGNQAEVAGGLFVSGGVGVVTGTRITKNTVRSSGGGGLRSDAGAQLTLRKVHLADNASPVLGGGMFVSTGSFAVVEGSTVKNNNLTTNSPGGGIYNAGQTVLRRTTVIGNQAGQGGGILNEGTMDLFTTKVIKNIAVTDAGGILSIAGTVNLNTATGTVVIKNRPNNCVGVPGCPG